MKYCRFGIGKFIFCNVDGMMSKVSMFLYKVVFFWEKIRNFVVYEFI